MPLSNLVRENWLTSNIYTVCAYSKLSVMMKLLVTELLLNSMGLFSRRWSSMVSQWCFVYKTNTVFPLVVHAWRLCLNLYEEQPILVH